MDTVEEKLCREAEKRKEELIELVQKLVRIKSLSGDKKNLSQIGELLACEMRETDLEVDLLEAEEGLTNVVGRHKGSKDAPRILFNGHTDVVPVQNLDVWEVDPFSAEMKNGRIYGRGACDMKGGLAAMIIAYKVLLSVFPEFSGNLILTATVDEEIGGFKGMKYIVDQGISADMGIVCEPSNFMITNVCKGLLWLRLITKGKSAHGSMPEKGVNAIYKMSKVLTLLERYRFKVPTHAMLGDPTISVGSIKGGTKPNVIPDRCESEIDVRYLPSQSHKDVMAELKKQIEGLKREDHQIEAELELIRYRTSVEIKKEEPVVTLIADALRKVIQKEPQYKGMPSPGDSEYLVRAGVPSVMFGPGTEELCHVDNEWISVDDLVTGVKIYALIMMNSQKH
jgi:succinyl-diaminopimelate desuccinylase